MTDIASIAIIGPGVVGTALGVLAQRAGLSVVAVGGRRLSAAQVSAARIGPAAIPMSMTDAASAADVVLLTVSDDAIESVCTDLARAGVFRTGAIIAHCSGALASDALSAAREVGCSIGSLHPLQTFPTTDAAIERFEGVHCFCEGDGPAVDVLTTLAEALGGLPTVLDSGGKALYHAGAVMAGNYTTALLDAACRMWAQAGIDQTTARQALSALTTATAQNAATMDLAQSLTGPIARGDVGTIRRHLEALEACSCDLRKLYCVAGLRTVDLALQKGTIDDNVAQQLRQTLCSKE